MAVWKTESSLGNLLVRGRSHSEAIYIITKLGAEGGIKCQLAIPDKIEPKEEERVNT